MAETRLERAPWRLVWRCRVCRELSQRRLPRADAQAVSAMFDRPYGSQISIREVEDVERWTARQFTNLLHAAIFESA